MARTVAMFNAATDNALTEGDGWLFMELLKIARSKAGGFNMDDYEDGAAYAALRGECEAREQSKFVKMPIADGPDAHRVGVAIEDFVELDRLTEERAGGVASVPPWNGDSGPEAAVPLPDGRTIPVELTPGDMVVHGRIGDLKEGDVVKNDAPKQPLTLSIAGAAEILTNDWMRLRDWYKSIVDRYSAEPSLARAVIDCVVDKGAAEGITIGGVLHYRRAQEVAK